MEAILKGGPLDGQEMTVSRYSRNLVVATPELGDGRPWYAYPFDNCFYARTADTVDGKPVYEFQRRVSLADSVIPLG